MLRAPFPFSFDTHLFWGGDYFSPLFVLYNKNKNYILFKIVSNSLQLPTHQGSAGKDAEEEKGGEGEHTYFCCNSGSHFENCSMPAPPILTSIPIDFRHFCFCFWGRYRFNNGDVYDGMFASEYLLLMWCSCVANVYDGLFAGWVCVSQKANREQWAMCIN